MIILQAKYVQSRWQSLYGIACILPITNRGNCGNMISHENTEIRPLHTLESGETAIIEGVYLHGAMRHRLLDLGWIPGTQIQRLQTAGSGDPTAYAVRGGVLALRQNDAKLVLVRVYRMRA